MSRVTLSLPEGVGEQLRVMSEHYHVSRTDIVSAMVMGAATDLSGGLETILKHGLLLLQLRNLAAQGNDEAATLLDTL